MLFKNALGSAGLTMGDKSLGADIVYAWPNAVIGTMDPAEAVKIMYAKRSKAADDAVAMIKERNRRIYRSAVRRCCCFAKRGYVDDIIKAEETRQRVIAAFEMLYTKVRTVLPRSMARFKER